MAAVVEVRMQETLVQGNDWLAFVESQERGQKPAAVARPPLLDSKHESPLDAWANTDRPLRPSKGPRLSSSVGNSNSPLINPDTVEARWLKEHDVHLEFVDGGIGCCWFAYHGDEEPVCGETEEAALEKLARANGVNLPVFQNSKN